MCCFRRAKHVKLIVPLICHRSPNAWAGKWTRRPVFWSHMCSSEHTTPQGLGNYIDLRLLTLTIGFDYLLNVILFVLSIFTMSSMSQYPVFATTATTPIAINTTTKPADPLFPMPRSFGSSQRLGMFSICTLNSALMYYNCTRKTHKLLNPPLLNPPWWTPEESRIRGIRPEARSHTIDMDERLAEYCWKSTIWNLEFDETVPLHCSRTYQ